MFSISIFLYLKNKNEDLELYGKI